MSKEELIKLLEKAKEDKYGNLYIEGGAFTDKNDLFYEAKKERKWYFTLTNTVCDDLVEEYCGQDNKNNFEIYDRHSWNDDILEIKIINNGNPQKREDY